MDFSTETLESLGREAKARIDQGDKAKDRAEQMYISAGLYLKEAKARVEKTEGITWVQYLIKHCPVGKSRSYELIAIADGRKTVEGVRAATNARTKDIHAKQREQAKAYRESSVFTGQSSPKTEQKQSRTPVNEARDEADNHHDAMLKRVIAMVKKLDTNQLTALDLKLREITQ
jgi:hypothetical protein